MTRRTWLILAGGIGLLLGASTPVRALLGVADNAVVLDPTNLVQNSWTAARALVSNQNEARELLQQAQQIAQDAKHLISIPVNTLQDLQAVWQQYSMVMHQGQSIIGDMKSTVAQFQSLYASGWGGNGPFLLRAQGLLGKVREVGAVATRADSLYSRLSGQQQRVQRLMTASQAAPGTLAAQQATNQLLGTLADQQASIQLIMAAQSEVQTSWIMSQVVAAEHASGIGQQQQIDPTRYLRTGTSWGQGPRLQ